MSEARLKCRKRENLVKKKEERNIGKNRPKTNIEIWNTRRKERRKEM